MNNEYFYIYSVYNILFTGLFTTVDAWFHDFCLIV